MNPFDENSLLRNVKNLQEIENEIEDFLLFFYRWKDDWIATGKPKRFMWDMWPMHLFRLNKSSLIHVYIYYTLNMK